MLRKLLREALLREGAHNGNKYGCVMLYLSYDQTKWRNLVNSIDDEDLYEPKGESGYGREKEPHITILYGLHTTNKDSEIEEVINNLKEPKLKLGKISSFKNDKFEVLKFEIESDDLHKQNKIFTEFPYTSDYPEYHPHCTIAYVKTGTADKYIKKLNKIESISVEADKIVYSKANGTKKNYNPF